jgi:hypothetical protein
MEMVTIMTTTLAMITTMITGTIITTIMAG